MTGSKNEKKSPTTPSEKSQILTKKCDGLRVCHKTCDRIKYIVMEYSLSETEKYFDGSNWNCDGLHLSKIEFVIKIAMENGKL